MAVIYKIKALKDFWLCNDVIEKDKVISVDRDTANRLISSRVAAVYNEPAKAPTVEVKQEAKPKTKK